MIHVVCQWLLLANLAASVLTLLYRDVNGRPALKPAGFSGIVGTLVVCVMMALLYWGAGAFSLLAGN